MIQTFLWSMKLASVVLLGVALLSAAPASGLPEVGAYERDVRALADPALEGRELGSKGAKKAAQYIERQFRGMGLAPAPTLGYRLEFPALLRIQFEESPGKNALNIAGPGSFAPLTLRRDYSPLPFSGDGKVENAGIVFAGYAISAPELGYDDFAGLDVRGKVVVAFRREPQEKSADSRFRGRDFTEHASFRRKALEVRKRGGLALIVVNNRIPAEEQEDLPTLATSSGPERLPIPVLLIRPPAIAPFFLEQGQDLGSLLRVIDKTGEPHSFAFGAGYRVTLAATLDGKRHTGANIVGWKPGTSEEYVVVGAHYDHIGRGLRFSMENGATGKIHPGADDNASGVAAMLALARRVAGGPEMKRGVLFVAFGGEEHGLFGSTALLHAAPIPGQRLAGMINFDMVGRLRDDELFVAGLESVPSLREAADRAAHSAGLNLKTLDEYPYNMSDHGTFLEAGVPAVLFFTGLHLEYHTSRDTADRIEYSGALRVITVAEKLLHSMRSGSESLEFVPGKDPGYERNFREMATPSNPYNNE